MTTHAQAILDKMKSAKYPELNVDFAVKLTNESDRGAILVGASKVETFLEILILKLLPSDSKNYRAKLLEYPGPLSTFSGKIELCYAFRIIDKPVYNSLIALKKIRNLAAHTNDEFSFKALNNQLEEIYKFEHGFPEAIHQQSYTNLLKWKMDRLKEDFEKENLGHLDHVALWNERVPDPDKDENIQQQLTVWKLTYGLTLLCLKIEVIMDELSS